MSDKRAKKPSLEVSSQSLQDELAAIKDRLSAIETIASISNADVVYKYVNEHIRSEKARAIVRECSEARTRSHLVSFFGFKSAQALDHHLRPLLRDDILRQKVEADTLVIEWSNLFRRLPRSKLEKILGTAKTSV